MLQRRLPWLIVVSTACLLASAPRFASSSTNGAPVAPTDSIQTSPIVAADGEGGAYIAWQEYRSGWGIYALRIMSDGSHAPGWPANGRLVSTGYFDPVMAVDGNRGIYVAAATGRAIGLWYVTSGGGVGSLPIPPLASVRSAGPPIDIEKESPTGLPYLISDGGAGAYLAWTQGSRFNEAIMIARLRPTWQAATFAGYGGAPVMCSDDSGGVLVSWGTGVVTRRVLSSGAVTPAWPLTSISGQVSADAGALVSDNAGGALVFWLDRRSGHGQVYAQHFTRADTIAAGWPADGLRISQAASDAGTFRYYSGYPVRYSSVAPDGAGGGFVAWNEVRSDSSDIYLQHVLPDGSLAPGWPADGLPVCTAQGWQNLPTIAADGSGGVLISWQDHRSGTEWDVYAQHVQGNGTVVWAADGIRVCGAAGDQSAPAIAADGSGGGILGWQDARCGVSQIFSSHIAPDGVLPVGPDFDAVAVAPTSSYADSGTIRLAWRVTAGSLNVALPSVYCRQPGGTWLRVGSVWPDPSGDLVYSDVGALGGCHYDYALGVVNCGVEQIMGLIPVDTPMGHGFTTLATASNAAIADSGRVRLSWDLVGGEGVPATIFRRDSCSTEWASLGTIVGDPNGRVAFEDHAPLFAGQRIYYRLVASACGIDHDLGSIDVVPSGVGFVPTTIAFYTAVADTSAASLYWFETSGPKGMGFVYRRDSTQDWAVVGTTSPYGTAHNFRDVGLQSGHRYEYRLRIVACGAQAWSEVVAVTTSTPGQPPVHVDGHPSLVLRSVRPNPAGAEFFVDFSLADGAASTLELLDASGRRLRSYPLGDLGPGEHSLPVDDPSLRSGIYLVRVSQGSHSVTRRVTIVR